MKRILFLLITIITLAACGKEQDDPVFNDVPLTGSWIGKNGSPYFVIENTKDQGTTERYLDYQEGYSRFLRRTYNDIPITYQIVYISYIEMKLVPKIGGGAPLEMLRIK